MLVVCADSHGTDTARLGGRTRAAVETADVVVHAGDLVTEGALDDLHAVAGGPVYAVHGNADEAGVRERLPAERTLVHGGITVAVTHTVRGGATALSLFGRERGADITVCGHTHRPVTAIGAPTLINPGSHTEPRGGPPTHVELTPAEAGLDGRVVTVDGDITERFGVEQRNG